jgi:hypothetical protein
MAVTIAPPRNAARRRPAAAGDALAVAGRVTTYPLRSVTAWDMPHVATIFLIVPFA